MEVTAGGSLLGDSAITNTVLSQCLDNPARQDMVRSVTTVLRNYTVDNRVATPTDYVIIAGNGIYNEIGSGQTDSIIIVPPLNTVTYLIRIENDGNMDMMQVTLTGSPASGGWSVTYHDGIDISAEVITGNVIVSTGWLRPGFIMPGEFANICVEVRPNASVLGGITGEYVNYVRVISNLDSTISDTIRTRTRADITYRADSGISNVAGGSYVDMAITSTDGVGQTFSKAAPPYVTVTYYIRLENDGNVNDTFSVTGTPGNNDWAVTYYDAPTGESVCGSITTTGWIWGPVTPTAYDSASYRIIRVEVTPLIETSGVSYTIYATIKSLGGSSSSIDVVKADTICLNFRPDLKYDTASTGTYTAGNGTYSDLTPPPQTVQQYTDNNTTVTYYIRVENDGQSDTFSLTASGVVANWTVSYYNETNDDITDAMRNGTYTRTMTSAPTWYDYRVEVTPDGTVPLSSTLYTYFYAYSLNSPVVYDVLMQNTRVRFYQADSWIKLSPDIDYIGDNIINTNGTNQTITDTAITNNTTVTYHIMLQNDGNLDELMSLTGSGSTSGWTVSYYDGLTATTDITNLVLTGALSGTIPAGGTSVIRVEITAGNPNVLPGSSVLTNTVLLQCVSNQSIKDMVRSVTTVIPDYRLDNQVATPTDYAIFAGNN